MLITSSTGTGATADQSADAKAMAQRVLQAVDKMEQMESPGAATVTVNAAPAAPGPPAGVAPPQVENNAQQFPSSPGMTIAEDSAFRKLQAQFN